MILFVEFLTYNQNQLEDKYYENGQNARIRKIYENFRSLFQTLVKITINFLYFSVFPIFVIFIIKVNANFSSLAEIAVFF